MDPSGSAVRRHFRGVYSANCAPSGTAASPSCAPHPLSPFAYDLNVCTSRKPNFMPPSVCDVSVTNVCNAACDFCGFARDKTLAGAARYVDASAFSRALPILHRRGIRFMTLQGGEPLVHPDIVRLVSQTTAAGISCAVITNGWFLPGYIGSLPEAGLDRLIISIDSANLAEHERNRGLEGLERRLAEGIAQAHASTACSVTTNCRTLCGA